MQEIKYTCEICGLAVAHKIYSQYPLPRQFDQLFKHDVCDACYSAAFYYNIL